MAIVNIKNNWSEEQASAQSDGTSGSRGAQLVYTILVDDPVNDTVLTVEADPLAPQIGDAHPGDAFRKLSHRFTDRISPTFFKMTASYGMIGVDVEGVPAPGMTPLDVRPSIEWDSEDVEDAIDEDVNGDPIQTATLERFDPPILETESHDVLVYIRNMPIYDPLFFSQFRNRVNSTTFLGWPPGTVLCKRLSASNVLEKGFEYWRVRLELHFRRRGKMTTDARAWWRRIKHQGFKVRDGAGGFKRALDDQDQPEVTPVLLDSNGDKTTTAEWLEFETKLTADFNTMGIIL